MLKYLKKNIFIILLIITFTFNCMLAYYNYVTLFAMGATLSQLHYKIEIHEIQRQNDIKNIYDSLIKTNGLVIANSESIVSITTKLIETIKNINENFKKVQTIDNPDIDKIKEANVRIVNFTKGYSGSGTYIKYKDKYYILTCAHLVENNEDFIYAETDDNNLYSLTLEKIDKDKDLALYKVNFDKELSYLEISEETPKLGSEVIVIGNPDGLTDIVTNGVISNVEKDKYYINAIIFFGNSGGALIYKGKVVGVISQIATYMDFPYVFVNYSIAVNLDTIQGFLRYLK